MRYLVTKIVAAAGAALLASGISLADNPGHHPAYLHALSDLRDARAHLERFSSEPINQEEEHAIENIDKAIGEIKKAAIMDGKNIADHVPVDSHMDRAGRFHRAMELLDRAKQDVSGEEDQSDTAGLQVRVLHHIDNARHSVEHAIQTVQNRA